METKGGGYVVVYIRAQMFYSGQLLSDGKDQRLSAKVWNSETTFLNSLTTVSYAGFFIAYIISTHTDWYSIIGLCECLFA